MTFAYYAGPDALKGLQNFHDKGEKVSKNALKKLESVILPEFYKKVADEMQEEKTTLKWLQKSFDTIILKQRVSLHLDHPGNSKHKRFKTKNAQSKQKHSFHCGFKVEALMLFAKQNYTQVAWL